MRLNTLKEFTVYEGKQASWDSLRESLPEYDSVVLQNPGSGYYLEGEGQALLKQIDMEFPNGDKGSVFIITSLERFLPDVKEIILDLLISIVLPPGEVSGRSIYVLILC